MRLHLRMKASRCSARKVIRCPRSTKSPYQAGHSRRVVITIETWPSSALHPFVYGWPLPRVAHIVPPKLWAYPECRHGPTQVRGVPRHVGLHSHRGHVSGGQGDEVALDQHERGHALPLPVAEDGADGHQ